MPFDADAIAERHHLKRSLSLWRFGAILAGVISLIVMADAAGTFKQDYVARIAVTGLIVDDAAQRNLLDQVASDNHAQALILFIDSPGGTTAGSEALYEAIRETAKVKPVVAVMGTVAASGGYIAALGADHIVARGNTLTGSIGVIFQSVEISGLMDKLGVSVQEVKSAPLKGGPSLFEPMDEAERKATRDLLMDTFDWFVALVAERRGLTGEQAEKLADGRVFTGRQAINAKLIDEIGGQGSARQWLAEAHEISRTLPVHDVEPADDLMGIDSFSGRALAHMFSALVAPLSEKIQITERLRLDGLVSVWHADAQ